MSFFKRLRPIWVPVTANLVFSVVLFVSILQVAKDFIPHQPPPPLEVSAGSPAPRPTRPPAPPWQIPAILFPALLLSLLNSYWLLLSYLRAQGKQAAIVLREIRRGNLSARLSNDVLSEVGGFTKEFNAMAEELELLVQRLRQTEKNRTELIQDIGHDIRHPLASIRVALETLDEHSSKLSADKVAHLHKIVLGQSREIEVMLEDLVTLNALRDGLSPKLEEFDLGQLCSTLCSEMGTLYPMKSFQFEFVGSGKLFLRTDPKLFGRMIRNALENARRFAKSEVVLRCGEIVGDRRVYIEIQDDGEGFSSQALEWFIRTHRQSVMPTHNTRESGMGIGSFVMRKLAESLGFAILLGNLRDKDKSVLGASVRFECVKTVS
jgi:signal transduction histidine kinase